MPARKCHQGILCNGVVLLRELDSGNSNEPFAISRRVRCVRVDLEFYRQLKVRVGTKGKKANALVQRKLRKPGCLH